MNSPSAAFRRSAAALEIAEVLLEALQILQDARRLVPTKNETPAPERVYVPHMSAWGTVQQIYNEPLIGVMLDDGIFMQTSRAFTSSVESAPYKEESLKSPLIDTEASQTAEVINTFQLPLF